MVMEETGLGAGAGGPPRPAFIWMQSLHGLAEDAQEASSPVRPGWKVGAGGSPGARAGALRRPKDPTHRVCPRGPPGCQMIGAGAVHSDD